MEDSGAQKQPDIAKWAVKALLRLSQLRAPGVYQFQLIIGPGGRRELVLLNQHAPHQVEVLDRGGE